MKLTNTFAASTAITAILFAGCNTIDTASQTERPDATAIRHILGTHTHGHSFEEFLEYKLNGNVTLALSETPSTPTLVVENNGDRVFNLNWGDDIEATVEMVSTLQDAYANSAASGTYTTTENGGVMFATPTKPDPAPEPSN